MYKVDYVFHAAALKQVPSCEFFSLEVVKINILGTDNVLTIAIECSVKKVICLSTDEAAYPINAMGIYKAIMEEASVMMFGLKKERKKERILQGLEVLENQEKVT